MTSQETTTKNPRDRELSATMFNLKEQRVLEKCLQTLHLQQTYSLRILDMGNRQVKVQYRKLKDKVSKIKSHLTVDDIIKFRELEMQGKLSSSPDCVVTSRSLKMAAAARRLNLSNDRPNRGRAVQSALPRISVPPDTTPDLRHKPSSYSSNSPAVDVIKRSKSLLEHHQPNPHAPQIAVLPQRPQEPRRQMCVLDVNNEDLMNDSDSTSPKSAVRLESLAVPETKLMAVDKYGSYGRSRSAYSPSHSPFSSHAPARKEARTETHASAAQSNNIRRLSLLSSDSIDSNLGENLFVERRLELLEEENIKTTSLDRRTQEFLRDVDDYLQRKPRVQSSQAGASNLPSESSSEKTRPYTPKNILQEQRLHKRDQFLEFIETPTSIPEDAYRDRLMTLWKDVNKCRYLRLPNDKLDLSGINTLAKDHMQLFAALRQSDQSPLKKAWE